MIYGQGIHLKTKAIKFYFVRIGSQAIAGHCTFIAFLKRGGAGALLSGMSSLLFFNSHTFHLDERGYFVPVPLLFDNFIRMFTPENNRIKIRTMWTVISVSILLMAVKFIAWYITGSIAILTDALESIINVVAGVFALSSVYYAAQPRDEDHPYGHGKIEYISAGFEGGLILIAGLSIIARAVYGLFHPHTLHALDIGIYLSTGAGLVNLFMGYFLMSKGKKLHSMILVADGRHLISDTVSSVGVIAGLAIIWLTGEYWLDNFISIILGCVILFTGYKLIRQSLSSLLDQADYEKLDQLIAIFNKHRRPQWIDIHNLRVLKYGSQLHVDAHLTLPWYLTLEQAHDEVVELQRIIKENMEGDIEFFIHADPCLDISCPVCSVEDCKARKAPYARKVDWNLENLLPDRKHKL
jgi:cation diffusion facilitator family transporter